MQCARCGRKTREFLVEQGITLVLEGEQKKVCYDCYLELKKEYDSKRTCEDCVYLKRVFAKK